MPLREFSIFDCRQLLELTYHIISGEIVASSRALQVEREKNSAETRKNLEKLLASSNEKFNKLVNF